MTVQAWFCCAFGSVPLHTRPVSKSLPVIEALFTTSRSGVNVRVGIRSGFFVLVPSTLANIIMAELYRSVMRLKVNNWTFSSASSSLHLSASGWFPVAVRRVE